MPPELVRAHQALDRAVDAAYGKKNFASEAERVAFLFERYQAITSLLPAVSAKKRKSRNHPQESPNNCHFEHSEKSTGLITEEDSSLRSE